MEKLKVGLIAGLTNGKIVFDYLAKNKFIDLVFVITHPDSYTGARHVVFPEDYIILKSGTTKGHEDLIQLAAPQLIIVAGWSELLSNNILDIPKLGTIGFHPSKLPFDRGRTVLSWQIEENYTDSALTMFYYSDFPDGGDIIAQDLFSIETNDYINDVLNKIDICTYNLITSYFPLIRKGIAPRQKQDLSVGLFRRKRTNYDSQIIWNSNSKNIYNKIRAISYPYPGAETIIEGKRYKIWKAKILNEFIFGNELLPGNLVATLFDNSIIMKTKDSFLQITEWELI